MPLQELQVLGLFPKFRAEYRLQIGGPVTRGPRPEEYEEKDVNKESP